MNWYGGSQETTPVAERCGPILGRTQSIGNTSRLLPHRRRCDALSDYFTITGPGVTFGAPPQPQPQPQPAGSLTTAPSHGSTTTHGCVRGATRSG